MSAYTEKPRVTTNEHSATGFAPSPRTEGDVACRARGIVEEHSLLSTVVCFGAGLAVGTVLGRLLAGPPERSASFRQRVLDVVENSMPDALREKLPMS